MENSKICTVLHSLGTYRDYIANELNSTPLLTDLHHLYEPAKYVLNLGGKRMRPILSMMACELFSGEFKPVKDAALGLEVFHNFTLVHDDMMDEAPLRRGKQTVHKKWDANTGLLSGDLLMIESYKLLANCPPRLLPKILRLYNITAIEVCEGQQMDMDFEQTEEVTVNDYLCMVRLKTAVLLGCSLQIGALVGGATDEEALDLYDFGVNLGIAFQLQDDLLDIYADPSKFGKQVGGDILANKKTYLLLTALERANLSQQAKLRRLMDETDSKKKVADTMAIYETLRVREKTEQSIHSLYQTAMEKLDAIQVDESRKNPLKALAIYLLDRDS